ncbi:MAG: biotin/lipoyl-binding protein, partial [Paludibacteraceae bacterium]|nr:biotin/lipoyl-binding protein [Paludibacteraceae bacterium]
MDKIIEKKKGIARAFTLKALPYWLGSAVAVLLIVLLARSSNGAMRIDPDTLTIATVTEGEFNDYIRLNGQVQPMTTIQLSPLEGGVVQEIIVEEGAHVKAGDRILVLSNDNLDLQILNSEAELAEKENLLRNTLISMEQQKLSLEQERLQL